MATLASVVAKQRESGKGVVGSLSSGIKEKLKEKFDPRQMLNQKGLLTALFPSLKAYKAKGVNSPDNIGSTPSLDVSALQSSMERIETNTKIQAKNSMVFPMMHRDFNLMRQNVIKLVKLEGGTPRMKADAFFMSAQDREKSYEAQVAKNKPTKQESETKEKKKSGNTFLIATGLILLGGYVLKELDILNTETLKRGFENFVTILTGSSSAQAAINRTPGSSSGGVLEQLHQIKFKDLNEKQQKAFLEKQFQSEGAVSGSIAKDLNNPGAMVYAPWQKEYGGEPGKTVTGPDGVTRTFAKFPSMEKGKEAQLHLWKSDAYANLPLDEKGKEAQLHLWKSDAYANLPLDEALKKWVAPANSPEAQTQFGEYARRGLEAIQGAGPTPGISSKFGSRVHPVTGEVHEHTGVDIPSPIGTPVMATKSGKISRVGPNGNYGNMIEIDHGDGTKSLYAHLSSMSVRLNEVVNEGQKIGEVGATGRVTGPHLHYEVIKNGEKVDPLKNALSSTNPISSVSLLASNPKFNGQAINNASAEVLSDDMVNNMFNGIFNINNNNVNVMASNEKSKDPFDGFSLLFGAAK